MNPFDSEPSAANHYRADLLLPILQSHATVTGRQLIARAHGESAAEWALRAYLAPIVLLAHNGAEDPIFVYANRSAQTLFERDWAGMVALPSRLSAEPDAQSARERVLDRVRQEGYCDDYAGVRVTATGRPFRISGAIVWNVLDEQGRRIGQAASFSQWIYVNH